MAHKVFDKFPDIEITKEFKLREINPAKDAADFLEYIQDKDVNKYLADEDIPKSVRQAEEELGYWYDLYRSYRSIYWGIALKKNDKLIGTCGFNIWSRAQKRAEISYDISKRFWGRGLGTASVKAMRDFAFCTLEVQRVQATVVTDNVASIRVLEKANFQKEGYLRHFSILHGEKRDSFMYSVLPSDIPF